MERLRSWLKSSNTTHQSLADRIGVERPTVTQWLSGRFMPSTEKLCDLSRITGISMEELLASRPKKKKRANA